MNLEKGFKPFIESLEKGIESENWVSSLMCACTLPDICTSLEGKNGRKSYMEWFDQYITEYKYKLHRNKKNVACTVDDWDEKSLKEIEDCEAFEVTSFSSVNAYALRCAILHGGNGEVALQDVQKANKEGALDIKKVAFSKTDNYLREDMFITALEREGSTIFLNPKIYCEAILAGVSKWIEEIKTIDKHSKRYSIIQNNLTKLLVIE